MNAHMIRIVEGPLPGDVLAANDALFDLSTSRTRETRLTLVSAPMQNKPAPANGNTDDAAPAKTSEQDDYVLGGYAGI